MLAERRIISCLDKVDSDDRLLLMTGGILNTPTRYDFTFKYFTTQVLCNSKSRRRKI